MRPVIDKYNWEEIKQSSEKDGWKTTKNNNPTIALNVSYAKEENYILLKFQNINQSVENKLFFS